MICNQREEIEMKNNEMDDMITHHVDLNVGYIIPETEEEDFIDVESFFDSNETSIKKDVVNNGLVKHKIEKSDDCFEKKGSMKYSLQDRNNQVLSGLDSLHHDNERKNGFVNHKIGDDSNCLDSLHHDNESKNGFLNHDQYNHDKDLNVSIIDSLHDDNDKINGLENHKPMPNTMDDKEKDNTFRSKKSIKRKKKRNRLDMKNLNQEKKKCEGPQQ